MNNFVQVIEVGPRDGLQNESLFIPTQLKIEYIQALFDAGISEIELTSFVSPKAISQMSDAIQVAQKSKSIAFKKHWSLVPNIKGFEAAQKAGIKDLAFFTATSETFTLKNINASIDESFARFEQIIQQTADDRESYSFRGYISTVFDCPYEKQMDLEKVLLLMERLFALGCHEVSLGDTLGSATPERVKELLVLLAKNKFSQDRIALHFHNTYGRALENIQIALDRGYRRFDSSSAGLGGCPYAPGAAGNVATEDLVQLIHKNGYETGIDVTKIILATQKILSFLQKKSFASSF